MWKLELFSLMILKISEIEISLDDIKDTKNKFILV